MLIFDHTRKDLQEMMARSVDGAMIWGGEEAVLNVRGLPFPHWARLAIFGPRISAAAMDADSWSNTEVQEPWCRRIARDVWQFDQQACSSPQALFLEKKVGHSSREFVQSLRQAVESENQLHPRQTIDAALNCADRRQAPHRADARTDLSSGLLWISAGAISKTGDCRHQKTVLAI
jgi:hypothetical protein